MKKHINLTRIFLILTLAIPHIHSVQLVYNMKVRRSFSAQSLFDFLKPEQYSWLIGALPIFYHRDRHITNTILTTDLYEKTLSGGSLFNVTLLHSSDWWVDLTTGVEHQILRYKGTETFNISRTGCDDILLTAGKNIFFQEKHGQCAFYGLVGIPTKLGVTPEEKYDQLVGTRCFSAGAGIDLSYRFFKDQNNAVTGIFQTRFVHFFDRHYYPILPEGAWFKEGNLTDVFLLLRYRHIMNVLEVGYDATFFTNQGNIVDGLVSKKPNYLRNSFYIDFVHNCAHTQLFKKPGSIGTGLVIGRAKFYDTKNLILWVSMSLLF